MNILVYNPAAKSSGALTVLEEYTRYIHNYDKIHKNEHKWLFMVTERQPFHNMNDDILTCDWAENNRFSQLYFNHVYIKKILRDFKIDLVISLQNIIFPNMKKTPQVVLIHNALMFGKYQNISPYNMRLYISSLVLKYRIKKSMQKSVKVLVQTNWMKNECIKLSENQEDRIQVIFPTINRSNNINYIDTKENRCRFFYPSSPYYYKNHLTILKAARLLNINGIDNYKIIFTFKNNANKYAQFLDSYSKEHEINVDFIGYINKSDIENIYSQSILLFPSYIESFGMPLLEAKQSKAIIIASNEQYHKDILTDYANVQYFNTYNHEELFIIMKKMIYGEIAYDYSFQEELKDSKKEFILTIQNICNSVKK
jgi:hypothetical protein